MRIFLTLISLLSIISAAQDISFTGAMPKKEQNYTKIYSVRFLSVPKSISEQKILKHIPKSIKKHTYFMNSGNYLTAMYQARNSYKQILKDLIMIHKLGYKDAYIRVRKVPYKEVKVFKKEHLKNTNTQHKLSKYTLSEIIYKANKAYKKNNYMQSIIYYEMLLSSGNASPKMKQNLCYLYGRIGAYLQAKTIIDNAHYPSQFIYAYAYGAATTGQENYYNNLTSYIPLDKTGRLLLLSGYYFEHKGDIKRALAFYKMAYEKNPSDNYNLYAYARAQDIANNKKDALQLYKQLLSIVKQDSQLYKNAQQRIQQLGE